MATMKLPVLAENVSADDMLRACATHHVGGAVVRSGENYALVTLHDLFPEADHGKPSAPSHVHRAMLTSDNLIEIAGPFANALIDAEIAPFFEAPLYVCPHKDDADFVPRYCRYHTDTQLEPVAR